MAPHYANSPQRLTPRSRKVQPSYLHHKSTNQPYVRIPVASGKRKTVHLGEHGSPESKAEYRPLLAELDAAASPAVVIQAGEGGSKVSRDLIVSELYRAFWQFAVRHYRHEDGPGADQLGEFRQTFRVALELHGRTHRFGDKPETVRPGGVGEEAIEPRG